LSQEGQLHSMLPDVLGLSNLSRSGLEVAVVEGNDAELEHVSPSSEMFTLWEILTGVEGCWSCGLELSSRKCGGSVAV
jgi:hypothetical protein